MVKKTNKSFEVNDKHNRNFSEAFKKQKVEDIGKGLVQISDVCKLHSVSRTSVYKWLYLYSGARKGHKTVVQMDSEEHKTKELLARLAELERVVGQKQLEIDFLNKSFEIASENLGYDLKKKYATRPSSGSGPTPPKAST